MRQAQATLEIAFCRQAITPSFPHDVGIRKWIPEWESIFITRLRRGIFLGILQQKQRDLGGGDKEGLNLGNDW